MSQKPFDFQKALSGLKTVSPAHTPSLDELGSPRPRRAPYRAMAVGLATTLAAVVFWPRPGSGLAWAQVEESMRESRRYHVRMTDPQGVPYNECWIDGDRYSFQINNPGNRGQAIMEFRCDGKYVVSLNLMGKPRNGGKVEAQRSKFQPSTSISIGGVLETTSNIVDEILRKDNFKVLEQKEVETPEGPRVRYRLSKSYDGYAYSGGSYAKSAKVTRVIQIYADPKTRLVMKAEHMSPTGTVQSITSIEYPEHIDDSVFKFDNPNVPIRDMDVDRKFVADTIRKGFGSRTVKGQTVTLRTVLYDRSGGLWVLWTGGLPGGDLSYPVRVVGEPMPRVTKLTFASPAHKLPVNAYGMKPFTASPGGPYKPSKVLPSINARLGGMAIGLINRTFQKVDVVVPVLDATGSKKLGEATFRNIPVHRIQSIYDYGVELGLR